MEVEVELQGKQGAVSNDLALTKRERENDVFEDTNNLLYRVLTKENMKLALNRVIANKGGRGGDKIIIYILLSLFFTYLEQVS